MSVTFETNAYSMASLAEGLLAGGHAIRERWDDDPIQVNCGRCAKQLQMHDDIKDKRTIDSENCEQNVPRGRQYSGRLLVRGSLRFGLMPKSPSLRTQVTWRGTAL